MSQDQILCVSYFDQVIGPNTLYCNEALTEIIGAPDLDKILEFNDEEGTFIFAYRKFQTVNHIFYIDSKIARGGKDLMMITYMIRTAIFKDEIVDVFKSYPQLRTEVIAASIRHPLHCVEAAKAGAHIATVPYNVLMQMIQHPLTDIGVTRFLTDWRRVSQG